jgi:hypothetical protein
MVIRKTPAAISRPKSIIFYQNRAPATDYFSEPQYRLQAWANEELAKPTFAFGGQNSLFNLGDHSTVGELTPLQRRHKKSLADRGYESARNSTLTELLLIWTQKENWLETPVTFQQRGKPNVIWPWLQFTIMEMQAADRNRRTRVPARDQDFSLDSWSWDQIQGISIY